MNTTENRPVFLNLLQIRQPVTAVLSILHRISGVLMVILLPGLVYALDLSLRGVEGFAQVSGLFSSPVAKGVAVLLCWMLSHHLLAGIRFMLLDFDVGVSKSVAQQTAWLAHAGAIIMTVLIAAGLLF
jgi:succinate dehydrogenase / fumarate reductase cytochrome b subunit